MVVTTFDLLNYLRCRRYASLDRNSTFRRNQDQINSPDVQSLAYLSVENNYQLIGFESEDSQKANPILLHQDATSQSIQIVSDLVKQTLSHRFEEGTFLQSQVHTHLFEDLYVCKTKIDLSLIESQQALYFTILPMTDVELSDLTFSVNKKKWPLFFKDADGIFRMHTITKEDEVDSNYEERLSKLSDRHTDMGRHVYDLAFQAYVLGNGATNRFILVLLNNDYVFDGQYTLQGMPLYTNELIRMFDFTEIVLSMHQTIEADLYRMINLIELNDDSRCPLVKNECMRDQPFECKFVDYCFSHIPKKNSILHYFNNHLGFREGLSKLDPNHDTYELINEGVVDMLDVPIMWLQREKNLMQRYCVENNTVYINKLKVRALLDTLVYPLYFLDFEANPAMLPQFSGEKPYSQSVFQYSIHIQKDELPILINDPNTHKEFLANQEKDHRLELVEQLLQDIPPGNSSVVVYHKTFEKNRLLELAALFPMHKARLLEIESRLFDLLKVVKNDYQFYLSKGFTKKEADTYNFYHPDLSGSYSLKKVLPIFAHNAYAELPINNGLCAYLNFALLPKMDERKRASTMNALLQYCRQDTYSMVQILRGMKDLAR
ncbi:MAG: DUF2779 domain-containing protein [bacterium]|nr:DUF2779 domain-containing protein [bacterium]